MQIEILGIAIEVTKKNIKNLHLRIKADGCVCLSAPRQLSIEDISKFAWSKIDWIKKHKARLKNENPLYACEYVSGENFYVFGELYTLCLEQGTRYSLQINGTTAVLTAPHDSTVKQRKRFLNEWYRALLKEQVEFYLPKWEKLTGLYSSSWQIKNMSTRWGTCNTCTKKIWLNLQLAKKPLGCLEYVILHELAHLRFENHGPAFESVLDRHMPNWKDVKKRLDNPPYVCK